MTAHSATKEEVEDIVGLDFAHSLRNKQMLKASVATDPKLLALLHHWYRTNANPEGLVFLHPLMTLEVGLLNN